MTAHRDGENMLEALRRALGEEMDRDDRVMVLGEDVGADGGIFRLTDGLMDRFGRHRVVDTPVAETGIVGTAVGLALSGLRPVAEIQFSGFAYQAFHHIESHMARYVKRSRGRRRLPMVVRMPCGAGVRALEHHSESREAYYVHTPGLTVVMPSTPTNAHGLLKSAIRSDEAVVFLEPKFLYRRYREEVPDDPDHLVPLGATEHVREGDDVTIVCWGAMRYFAEATADVAEREDVAADVYDLRTLSPLDLDPVVASVKRTGRCIVLQEGPRTCGLAAEVAARINEEALWSLEAPVQRVTAPDVHTPLFAREWAHVPTVGRALHGVQQVLQPA